tara:strand:- start:2325 stop:2540 length:216 start_codon:yes stop_codon:yes gene_type:complete
MRQFYIIGAVLFFLSLLCELTYLVFFKRGEKAPYFKVKPLILHGKLCLEQIPIFLSRYSCKKIAGFLGGFS